MADFPPLLTFLLSELQKLDVPQIKSQTMQLTRLTGELSLITLFCPKNDGVVVIFSFLLLKLSKTFLRPSKKDPTFGFLTFEYTLKN